MLTKRAQESFDSLARLIQDTGGCSVFKLVRQFSLHFDPPPTILAYLEKAEYTFWHPHDGRIAAQLSRIVYLKQVHHLGCPSARKCGILCFSA